MVLSYLKFINIIISIWAVTQVLILADKRIYNNISKIALANSDRGSMAKFSDRCCS